MLDAQSEIVDVFSSDSLKKGNPKKGGGMGFG